MALAEEYVTRYDIDGLELDWVFEPYFLKPEELEANTPLLTDYLEEILQIVVKAAAAKGKSIALGARVLPTVNGNRAAGLDVPSWIERGLLDFVVPNFYGCNELDTNFPSSGWWSWPPAPTAKSIRRCSRGSRVTVRPCSRV